MEKKMITDLHKVDAFKANGMYPSAQLPNQILLYINNLFKSSSNDNKNRKLTISFISGF